MRNDIVPLIDMDKTFQQNISPVFALCFHDIIPAALRLLSGSPYCTLVDSVGRGSYYLPRPLFFWARRRNGGIKSNSLKADNNIAKKDSCFVKKSVPTLIICNMHAFSLI